MRQLLGDHFDRLAAAADTLVDEACERARGELAEQLNQAARRLRQAAGTEELAATLADAAAAFAAGAAVFVIDGETARGARIRGVTEAAEETFRSLAIPLSAAAALAGAVESRDPVTAAATPGELSAAMVELAGHAPEGRVSIFPVTVRERVAALLYTWGAVRTPAAELLAQVAAGAWTALEKPAAERPPLVQIEVAPPGDSGEPRRKSWDELPPEVQELHLRAQRFARVRAASLRLREPHAVEVGRARHDLYTALQSAIDQAREEFRARFFAPSAGMVDYFHLELVRTLANDDAELLGKDYPGPMV
jgi:hypothetical protein